MTERLGLGKHRVRGLDLGGQVRSGWARRGVALVCKGVCR